MPTCKKAFSKSAVIIISVSLNRIKTPIKLFKSKEPLCRTSFNEQPYFRSLDDPSYTILSLELS